MQGAHKKSDGGVETEHLIFLQLLVLEIVFLYKN